MNNKSDDNIIRLTESDLIRGISEGVRDFYEKFSLRKRRERNDFCFEHNTDYVIEYKKGIRCINPDNVIFEGLIQTYPTNVLIRQIIKAFRDNSIEITEKHIETDLWNDDNSIAGYIGFFVPDYLLSSKLNDDIKRVINTCGYYIAWAGLSTHSSYKGVTFQIEPKYQVNKDLNIGEEIYHVTTESRERKIVKIGLCPKNSNNANLNYDGRVYFFINKDKLAMAMLMKEAGRIKKDDRCRILTINTRLLNKDIKFFVDPNMPVKCCYTYQNIPPSAITEKEDLFEKTKEGLKIKKD